MCINDFLMPSSILQLAHISYKMSIAKNKSREDKNRKGKRQATYKKIKIL